MSEIRNVYDLATAYADRVERGELSAREALAGLAREVVLEAGRVCELRVKIPDRTALERLEAAMCTTEVAHWLLCRENESVCLSCEGVGCTQCVRGVVRVGGRRE